KIKQQPSWFDTIPIIVAGGWDSEPATQRRWGRLGGNYMDEYKKRISEEKVINLKESGITLDITHFFKGFGIEGEVEYMENKRKGISEENVMNLKESGITLVITHFFKGFGIEGEGEYMENTRKFAELCHKHGLRVGAYIGNTVIPEQLLLELPEVQDWLVPDY